LLATAQPGSTQALAHLTVQSFAISTDAPSPRVDVPFHLVVDLHVRERVTQVANLELPMLAQLELLGDERQTISDQRGTEYRETITVIAHDPGTVSIAPATLQAVDARDGRPKQWYTNSLTLHVIGAPSPAFRDALHTLLGALGATLRFVLWIVGIGCFVVIAVLLMRRRRASPVVMRPAAMQPLTPTAAPRSRRDQLNDALLVLRAERSRSTAVRVRGAVWRMLGAAEGETLGDVLRRREASDPTLRALLISLERSAFTYDDDLARAIEDACTALERCIESAA
jgi:hypothetical protein